MSTERYEIREKIGQGGVGAVYKAFDTQLNREVAMKRLLTEVTDESQISSKDATESLLQEATALGSLQHPHIVTVYDAGVDEDGPYVVMELIKGRTLDEMVGRGTLTWEDLYEVALQTQEALIAAQDLNLVHRDLKPSNIMLCWLASGKFQIKIVDFGLAKFSAAPSLQTIDHGDAVFGSIFFMAPEQFERTALDQRTDMYAMGCLYYYALTGQYPFSGETAPAVMASHLQHTIIDLKELRPDIPAWAADWVMWHMERKMDDRPLNARIALEKLLIANTQDDTAQLNTPPSDTSKFNFGASPPSNKTLEQASPMEPTQPIRSIHEESEPTAPVSIMAPGSNAVNPHTQAQNTVDKVAATTSAQVLKTTPQTTPTAAASANTAPNPEAKKTPESLSPSRNKLPQAAKISIILILSLTTIVAVSIFFSLSDSRKEIKAFNSAIAKAKTQEKENKLNNEFSLTGLSLTLPELNAILNKSASNQEDKERHILPKVLSYVEGKDFDADPVIVKFITESSMGDDQMRIDLLKIVMLSRNKTSNVEPLLKLAETTTNTETAVAAIKAAKANIGPENTTKYFADFLDIINNSSEIQIINASEKVASEIVSKAKSKGEFSSLIINSYESATNDDEKYALLRLLGTTGTETAGKKIMESLNAGDNALAGAAISALKKWPNSSLFDDLIKYIQTTQNKQLKNNAFTAASSMISPTKKVSSTQLKESLETLNDIAFSDSQKFSIISRAATITEGWADAILVSYINSGSRKLAIQAKKARANATKLKSKGRK